MSNPDFHKITQTLLDKQQILTTQMLNLLKQEYQALCTIHAESLTAINTSKQPLIIEIDALNQQWLKMLTTESVELNPECITQFLQQYDQINGSTLSENWEKLQNMAKDCQKANTINGTIITLRNQSAKQTMAILRGQVPSDIVYNPNKNNTTAYVGGKPLAKA